MATDNGVGNHVAGDVSNGITSLSIADLHDEHGLDVQLADPVFRNYGGRLSFAGEIETIRVFNDFKLVKQVLQSPGRGRVLVIDGGGSSHVALLGDRLAKMGVDNQWSGIIVNGCIRDSGVIATLPIGVKALNTCPIKPSMVDDGEQGVRVMFAHVIFEKGHVVYADGDGVLVSPHFLR